MSAVLLPSWYAETVGKPCPECGGSSRVPDDDDTFLVGHYPCPDCIEGVVRERYVVAKAETVQEVWSDLESNWEEWTLDRYNDRFPWEIVKNWLGDKARTRVVPVEPLGETDWYIATEQSSHGGLKSWHAHRPTCEDPRLLPPHERRFAITHVAHNVRELPVVDDEAGMDGNGLWVFVEGNSVLGWDPVIQDYVDITDEPWASDLAPGDLVLELTEPPVLLDEPIVESGCGGCDECMDTSSSILGIPGGMVQFFDHRIPLVLTLGVNKIELP